MLVGVDIGGTFTDFVFLQDGERSRLWTHKVASTPSNLAAAVLAGLAEASGDSTPQRVIHGSTVATNALVERKGARTALITTAGFADVLEIGRQARPALYDLFVDRPAPLVPRELRFEVDERVNARGEVLKPLDAEELEPVIAALRDAGVESVAVGLLFSFLHPAHEAQMAERLRAEGFLVSASSEVLPLFREYERISTTTVNAYLTPVVDRYLSRLDAELGSCDLRVMQSNGGTISADLARRQAVRQVLSGPAAGVVGARHVAALAGLERIITFDMGGTSTDVSLCDGTAQTTTEAIIGGYPIGVPVIDINTVGAGGGSIAHVDTGGALRVGPQSAGADPGPAAYGQGDLPTVTDANIVLNRLPPDLFLGGRMSLDASRARQVLGRLAESLGLDLVQTALGVIEVANANMERAMRVISVERGHDPRDFALLSFGGAGGLHATALARRLGIPRVIVPPNAATLSAFGLLAADVVKDYSHTVMLAGGLTGLDGLAKRFDPLVARAKAEMREEGMPESQVVLERLLDMRYAGQSYELSVPFGPDFAEAFHQQHRTRYGHSEPAAPTEVVNVRLRAVGVTHKPEIPTLDEGDGDPRQALIDRRRVVLNGGERQVSFYDGPKLEAGDGVAGPAIVVEPDTTVLLQEGDQARVDKYRNLIIEVG